MHESGGIKGEIMEAIKINDTTIEITKQPETPAPIKVTYDYNFLLSQKAKIIKDANDYLAAREKELDEVLELLAKCDELGIAGETLPEKMEE